MKSIPQSRLLLYFLIISLIPILFVIHNIWGSYSELLKVSESISDVSTRGAMQELKQRDNKAIHQHYLKADHFYIDKRLESMRFLENEQQLLKKVIQAENLVVDPSFLKRLEFLEEENRMIFSEGDVQTYENFTETQFTLSRPVELSISDLKRVLSRIEDIPFASEEKIEGKPQLLITDFKVRKKQQPGGGEVLSLTMKLLKREFFE